eukprot:TRINITY_DN4475_c0_g2_i3.p2 TRINITY_DN4475_c0_g2~~TRINITY_DN4475_c0_g2_i3.p2  ORF type:complete len:168 (+),score=45.98 TRINITY_DN4475_c0_g2_i3:51-554(+)
MCKATQNANAQKAAPMPMAEENNDDPEQQKKGEEMENEDDDEMFPTLTREKIGEMKKFAGNLKAMQKEDKINFILDVIQPKRFNPSFYKKKYVCSAYKCLKVFTNAPALKNHLSKKHKKLIQYGLDVNDNGQCEWPSEMMDYALMLVKMYPKFAKSVLKEMKKINEM